MSNACFVSFDKFYFINFFLSEKSRLEKVEKERNRQEQIKLEKEEEEKAKKILLAEKEKELANRNPENLCPSLPKVCLSYFTKLDWMLR